MSGTDKHLDRLGDTFDDKVNGKNTDSIRNVVPAINFIIKHDPRSTSDLF